MKVHNPHFWSRLLRRQTAPQLNFPTDDVKAKFAACKQLCDADLPPLTEAEAWEHRRRVALQRRRDELARQ